MFVRGVIVSLGVDVMLRRRFAWLFNRPCAGRFTELKSLSDCAMLLRRLTEPAAFLVDKPCGDCFTELETSPDDISR